MGIKPPKNDKYYSANVFTENGYLERYTRVFSLLMRYINPHRVREWQIIDLGCGLGGFGRKFLEMGGDVVFIDGRSENIADLKADLPDARAFVMDVENDSFPEEIKHVDLVLCMGLLYHTKSPKVVLEKIAGISDNVCVETRCLDHDGVALIYFEESTEARSYSLSGGACSPSPKWVKETLKEVRFSFVKDISHKDANTEPGPGFSGNVYDWEFQRTCGWRRNECSLRKLFVASKSIEESIFQL